MLISTVTNVSLWLIAEVINVPQLLLQLELNQICSAKIPVYGYEADYNSGCQRLLLMTPMYGPAAVCKGDIAGYRKTLICIRPV
jgi:hypothetical protein